MVGSGVVKRDKYDSILPCSSKLLRAPAEVILASNIVMRFIHFLFILKAPMF